MKSDKTAPAWRGRYAIGLLALVLAVLFWRSFLPGVVHFSNDGPLGVQNCNWLRWPAAMSGLWDDLNSLGSAIGAWTPDLTMVLRWGLGPVGYSKFLAPIALFVLGLGSWTLFRNLGFGPLACTLGALAAPLNSTFFSTACWGVASQQIADGMDFFALALVVSSDRAPTPLARWSRLILAGLAVGINVIQGADIGAIFSLFIGAFVVAYFLSQEGAVLAKAGRGVFRVAVIAVFAAFMALQTVSSVMSTQIHGIAGMGGEKESKAEHWDWATQWSLPKKEALGLIIPGLFGYRMDTPNLLPESLQDSYRGGNYWGGIGRDPAIDRYLEGDRTGPMPPGNMRFSGGGCYAGVLVVLVALWAVGQSLRRQGSVFTLFERRILWFCAAVGVLGLLLSFGRFAPFYQVVYAMPYFSTIRNPVKFIAVVSFVLVILFGFGIQGLSRLYLSVPLVSAADLGDRFKKWRAKAGGFDLGWAAGCLIALAASVAGWLAYSAGRERFVQYLQTVQFDEGTAQMIAGFSVSQVAWFAATLALAVGLFLLVMLGVFAGRRAKLGGFLIGLLVVADLARANLPWIIHWDYEQKYATNPVIEFLRQKPYEHRVILLPFRMPADFEVLDQIYRYEWSQHHFMYYNIQSLDVVQMPRVPEDLKAFEEAIGFRGSPDQAYLLLRRWQLTNTRYLLGPAGYLDVLNKQLDPEQQRFRIAQQFDLVPKPGIVHPSRLEEMTAMPAPGGKYALFEFTAALPRASLYPRWQVSTNDAATLKSLGSAEFDPARTVLVSNPIPAPVANATNATPGTVEFTDYHPTHITFDVNATTPSVLLLNDKYDAAWQVRVDGQPATLLRCNYIMRGVQVAPGRHKVEFSYEMLNFTIYVTLAAIGLAVLLMGVVYYTRNPVSEPETPGR